MVLGSSFRWVDDRLDREPIEVMIMVPGKILNACLNGEFMEGKKGLFASISLRRGRGGRGFGQR